LKVTTEELENCQIAMTIEVEDAEAEKALRKAARTLSRRFNISGFRPGKAPYNIVVQRVGIEAIQEQVVDDLAEKLYKQALKEREIEPYASASLDEVAWHPLTLHLTIPMPPSVTLGAYRDLRLAPEEAVATDEQVEEVLERIRKQNATWQPVERPAQFGDMVTIDIEATVDGEVVLNKEGREMTLPEDSYYPVPGFSQAVVGMQAGEERVFELPYPEDYYRQDLAGHQARFHVLMDSVKEEVLPPVDDALAMTVGYESADELEEAIRGELLQQAQREADERFVNTLLDRTIEEATIAFPPVMLEHEIDAIVKEQDKRLRQQGMKLEQFLEIRNLTEEEFREEVQPHAEKRLHQSLILSEVMVAEKLALEDDEVEEEIERRSSLMGEQADGLKKILSSPVGRLSVGNDLLTRKALDRLVAIAKGEAPELEPEESEETVTESESGGAETPADEPVFEEASNERQIEVTE
jgi:trigger factor